MPNTTGFYYPRLRLQAPGAPEQILGDSVLRAMATIARDTGAFRKDIVPISFVSGTAAYPYVLDGFRFLDFSEVWFIEDSTNPSRSDADKTPIERISHTQMHTLLLDDATGQRPEAWAHTLGVPGSISFYPFNLNPSLPNAVIHATAEVVPTRLAAQAYYIDPDTAHWGADAFFDINEELIQTLALAYVLDYPNKPWSNRTYSMELKRVASNGIAELRSLADDGMRAGLPRAVKYGGY